MESLALEKRLGLNKKQRRGTIVCFGGMFGTIEAFVKVVKCFTHKSDLKKKLLSGLKVQTI
jgi:hypothetical protein